MIGFKGLRYVIVFQKLLLLLKKVPKDNVRYHYKGHIEVCMCLHIYICVVCTCIRMYVTCVCIRMYVHTYIL